MFFSVDEDGRVMSHEMLGSTRVLGKHSKGAKSVRWSVDRNAVISASWAGEMSSFDPREKEPLVRFTKLKGKAYSLDVTVNRVAVACAGEWVQIFDLRNLAEPVENRKAYVKHMIRTLRCSPDGSLYALGTVEGRVGIEYFEDSSLQKRFSFKCHRKKDEAVEMVYPVNAIGFTSHGTFATGGCDGVVAVWDSKSKKRVCMFAGYDNSVASLSFSCDDSLLAVAASYTYEKGALKEGEEKEDAVYVRSLNASDILPRTGKRKAQERQ
mgnify:CR=1 FL=1